MDPVLAITITVVWFLVMACCMNSRLGTYVYFRILSVKEWMVAKLLHKNG